VTGRACGGNAATGEEARDAQMLAVIVAARKDPHLKAATADEAAKAKTSWSSNGHSTDLEKKLSDLSDMDADIRP
jgi:hypothetical protein